MEHPDVHARSSGSQVSCPECGRSFTRRGLAGHRRLAHGPRPNGAAPPAADLERVESSLAAICRSLERLDQRLERLERRRSPEGEGELEAVKRELEGVLMEIAQVQAEQAGARGDDAACATRRAECHRALGRLRRRQVELLHQLGSGAPGDDASAGFDLWDVL